MAQVLQHQMPTSSVMAPTSRASAYHKASAPEMISISSLVMIA